MSYNFNMVYIRVLTLLGIFYIFEIFKQNNDRNAIFDYYAGIKVAVISEK